MVQKQKAEFRVRRKTEITLNDIRIEEKRQKAKECNLIIVNPRRSETLTAQEVTQKAHHGTWGQRHTQHCDRNFHRAKKWPPTKSGTDGRQQNQMADHQQSKRSEE